MSDRHADSIARLTRLRALVKEATNPGRWHWSGNMDHEEPQLCTWVPGSGRTSVLAVMQKGRRRAKLVFNNQGWLANASGMAIHEVSPSAEKRDDPRVYRADIIGIRHPDATLIVAAVNAMPAVLDDIEARLTQHAPTTSPVGGVSGSADHLFIHACRTCRNSSPCPDYRAAEALLKAMGGE